MWAITDVVQSLSVGSIVCLSSSKDCQHILAPSFLLSSLVVHFRKVVLICFEVGPLHSFDGNLFNLAEIKNAIQGWYGFIELNAGVSVRLDDSTGLGKEDQQFLWTANFRILRASAGTSGHEWGY